MGVPLPVLVDPPPVELPLIDASSGVGVALPQPVGGREGAGEALPAAVALPLRCALAVPQPLPAPLWLVLLEPLPDALGGREGSALTEALGAALALCAPPEALPRGDAEAEGVLEVSAEPEGEGLRLPSAALPEGLTLALRDALPLREARAVVVAGAVAVASAEAVAPPAALELARPRAGLPEAL